MPGDIDKEMRIRQVFMKRKPLNSFHEGIPHYRKEIPYQARNDRNFR